MASNPDDGPGSPLDVDDEEDEESDDMAEDQGANDKSPTHGSNDNSNGKTTAKNNAKDPSRPKRKKVSRPRGGLYQLLTYLPMYLGPTCLLRVSKSAFDLR